MKAQEELVRILDMDNPWDEAHRKLRGTIMRVNGVLTKVVEFNDKDKVYVEDNGTGDTVPVKVKSLEVFLPESGIYKDKNGSLALITKIPKRQWLKSYHNSFYQIINFDNVRSFRILDCIEESRVDIIENRKHKVFYWDKEIGYVNDQKEVICTNALFEQELIEWARSRV